MKDENIVRKILMSEVTWVIMIIGAVSSFYTMVVLPLHDVANKIAQLQIDVTQIRTYDARITQNSNDIIVLQQIEKK